VASEAQPPQAGSASASCSAASASEARDNEADTSSRSARESGLEAIADQYAPEETEALAMLLDGVPKKGGFVSRKIFKEIIRIAFRGGVIAVLTRPPDADPAVGQRALARNCYYATGGSYIENATECSNSLLPCSYESRPAHFCEGLSTTEEPQKPASCHVRRRYYDCKVTHTIFTRFVIDQILCVSYIV